MSRPVPRDDAPPLATGRGLGWLVLLALAAAVVAALAAAPAVPALPRALAVHGGGALVGALGGFALLAALGRAARRLGPGAQAWTAVALITLGAAGSWALALWGLGALAGRPPAPEAYLALWRPGLAAVLVAGFFVAHMRARHLARQAQDSSRAATLQALQSRIRPHFLFNSMNSIAGLLRAEPDRAERALQDLADVFRVLLADARKLVPITAESELARQYLEIERLRLGDRLQYKWNSNGVPANAQIPSLTLQPLLENAVYHGIEPSFAGGTVTVDLWVADRRLNVLIGNPLPEVPHPKHRKGNQIAMDNIRQRLQQHFGDRADLTHFEKGGAYYVRLRLPVVRSH